MKAPPEPLCLGDDVDLGVVDVGLFVVPAVGVVVVAGSDLQVERWVSKCLLSQAIVTESI